MAKIFSAPSVTVSKLSAANILTTSGGSFTGQLGTMGQMDAPSDVWGGGSTSAPVRAGM